MGPESAPTGARLELKTAMQPLIDGGWQLEPRDARNMAGSNSVANGLDSGHPRETLAPGQHDAPVWNRVVEGNVAQQTGIHSARMRLHFHHRHPRQHRNPAAASDHMSNRFQR